MRTKKLIFVAILIFCCAAFTACGFGGDDDGNGGNGGNDVVTELFDISALNYNPRFAVENNGENGYFLYDSMDFNLIEFRTKHSRAPLFVVKQGNKKLAEIMKTTDGYPSFQFNSTGEITVEVHLFTGDKTVKEEFTVKVGADGFPTRVEFEMLDENGNALQDLEGGISVKLRAKVYSENTLLETDNEKYISGWKTVFIDSIPLFSANALSGTREVTVSLPNMIDSGSLTASFEYKPSVKNLPVYAPFIKEVASNLEKIEVDWGYDTDDGNLSLSYLFQGMISSAKANYRFKNGDKQDINIKFLSDSKAGDLVPFIRYNGEEDFNYYTGTAFDYSAAFTGENNGVATRYMANGVSYYFNPLKTSAEIYLAKRYAVSVTGGTLTRYEKVHGSELNLTFQKNAPTSISVDKITGWELEHYTQTGVQKERSVSFQRDLTDNKVSAYVYVARSNEYGLDKQHFIPSVAVDGSPFQDYYYIYNWNKVQILANGRCYGDNKGLAEIQVVSCHDDNVRYAFTVEFLNPVTETRIQYKDSSINLFLKFDPSFNVSVREKYYNYDEVTRNIAEDEHLVYYYKQYTNSQETEISATYFVPKNTKYKDNYSMRLCRNGEIVSDNALKIECYIAPDYYIEIGGTMYRMSDFNATYPVSKNYYIGYAPYIKAQGTKESIILYKDVDGNRVKVSSDEAYITNYQTKGVYNIVYKGFEGEANIGVIELLQ